jgi:F0F1-type ATP synthase alpha subunit
MTETNIQFIAILAAISALLGWLLKQVITYFIKSANEKSKYIEELVAKNQTNTENFVNTINHQRTLDREMQGKTNQALQELKAEISNTNKINERMLDFYKDK